MAVVDKVSISSDLGKHPDNPERGSFFPLLE